MKNIYLMAGALSLAAPHVCAQETAPAPDKAPVVLATPPVSSTSQSAGYNLLVEAGKLILPGENGSPAATETYAPEENLRRQRLAVARNAPALALARRALQLPIDTPIDDAGNFGPNGSFRELARQFIQESAVREADGDFAGALDSRFDCIEMGAAVSRGPITSLLVGSAIESVGHRDLAPIAAKLDRPQSRAAAARLQRIAARRPTFAEVLRIESQMNLRLALPMLPNAEARAKMLTPEALKEAKAEGASDKEVREFLALTPETLRANNARLYNTLIGAAGISYRLAPMVPLPRDLDNLTGNIAPIIQNPQNRFAFERSVAQNRLLQSALQLRAVKLETGTYPENFSAPRDPFADEKPLVYRRVGENYLLYSVGPDARDNGGKPLQSQRRRFDPESGLFRVSPLRGVMIDSRGDLLAPAL